MKIQPMSFFLSCLAVWLLSACCRSETYYVDQEVKDFRVFPVGSWWVYVDSVSGRSDSVVMGSCHSEIIHEMDGSRCDNKIESMGCSVKMYYKLPNTLDYLPYSNDFEDTTREYRQNTALHIAYPPILQGTKDGTISNLLLYNTHTNTFFRPGFEVTESDTLIGTKKLKSLHYSHKDMSFRWIRSIGLTLLHVPSKNQYLYLTSYEIL